MDKPEKKTGLKKQGVFVPPEIVKEIKKLHGLATGTQHGALQKWLTRGAELALQELRESIEGNNKEVKVNTKSQIPWYDSPHVSGLLTDIKKAQIALNRASDRLKQLKRTGEVASGSVNQAQQNREAPSPRTRAASTNADAAFSELDSIGDESEDLPGENKEGTSGT